ncbi:hypothetical protein [Nostoc sp. 106C]|uniref:hypothetical protein n=1 Tax=Nostoc sp. 106C TaxID=1932667 RepID=UPI000A382BDD|nr:hypothetical protein [Nostoc sp. 106C]OUL26739.1 hypothetical protein BV375_20975 [Nostoc sp. 106C]
MSAKLIEEFSGLKLSRAYHKIIPEAYSIIFAYLHVLEVYWWQSRINSYVKAVAEEIDPA